jgi:diguanylate cyclase (GGDEF)-like protein
VDPFPPENPFPPPGDEDSHGSQLFLYRLIRLAATQAVPGDAAAPLSYAAVRQLAARLGIGGGAQLSALFRDLGLGILQLDIGNDRITVSRTRPNVPAAAPGPDLDVCELERGLIDGALALITGMPVTTVETMCLARGDECCRFEAVCDNSSGSARFVGLPANSAAGAGGAAGIPVPGGPGNRAGGGQTPGNLRTWYLDLAVRELARARRHGRHLTVMYVDLDNLGQINAAHGRAAGDQVIKAVGTALSRGCRSEDFLWHHGEDEFAILLAETGEDGAGLVARRLATEVLAAAEYVDVAARISASIGFATFPIHADSVPELFETARSAVYLAKSLGKGRSQAARQGRRETKESAREKGSPESAAADGRLQPDLAAATDSDANLLPGTTSPDEPSRAEPVASVVIASGSPLLMTGMRQVLEGAAGLRIVAEIADPGRLPAVVADLRPDLIFADLEMAANDEFAVLNLLRRENLPCKFSVFAVDVDKDVIKLAADFGIEGVILQDSGPEEVLAALLSIYQGRTVLPAQVQEAMIELNKNRHLLEELSEREIEVLRLVAEGKSNAQIANELFITVNTVRFHLANIYQKLSVANRTEAANYFLRQDLAPDGQTRLL